MRLRWLRSIGKSGICSTGTHSTRVDPQDIYLAHGADLTDTGPDINEAEMIRWISLDESVRRIDRGEIVGAATVAGVYRALPEDRGSVAGRTPESADLRSPNGSTPPTPSKG
ncbi:hypothetical protein [Nocardia sienata]|uniref:hypothetical protein n=1 Tax=Nocardia sienata TaxID=248552 RepID=UPI0007A527F1|nr:hypothetical protein [Nocardia sienata]